MFWVNSTWFITSDTFLWSLNIITTSKTFDTSNTFFWSLNITLLIKEWWQRFVKKHLGHAARHHALINLLINEAVYLQRNLILKLAVLRLHLSLGLEVGVGLNRSIILLYIDWRLFLYLFLYFVNSIFILFMHGVYSLIHLFKLLLHNKRINLHSV